MTVCQALVELVSLKKTNKLNADFSIGTLSNWWVSFRRSTRSLISRTDHLLEEKKKKFPQELCEMFRGDQIRGLDEFSDVWSRGTIVQSSVKFLSGQNGFGRVTGRGQQNSELLNWFLKHCCHYNHHDQGPRLSGFRNFMISNYYVGFSPSSGYMKISRSTIYSENVTE